MTIDLSQQERLRPRPRPSRSLRLEMPSVATLLFVAGTLLVPSVLAVPRPASPIVLKRALDTYIATETPYALQGILANIGATGSGAQGTTDSGIVVASPDETNPDCQ